MIDYNDILYFDTETTGLPPKGAQWDIEYESFPRICQLSWIFQGKENNYIIRPDGWVIPEEATAVHGITNEYAQEHGVALEFALSEFIRDCKDAKLICGHNIYFDISIVKSEYMRRGAYNDVIDAALYKGKRIDTMRPSMAFVDARFSNGRLKFPKLEELYARCFPGETFPAHDAIEDVRAVVRCLPVLVRKGLIELAVKEYYEIKVDPALAANVPENAKSGTRPANDVNQMAGSLTRPAEKAEKCATNDSNVSEVGTPVGTEKASCERKQAEITHNDDMIAKLMADDNF